MAGHALQKHAGRNPDIWGKVSGNSESINNAAMQHIDDILKAPGDFNVVESNGHSFLEKMLSDGRGIRLNMDGTFKDLLIKSGDLRRRLLVDYIEIVLRNIKSVQIEDVFYDCVSFGEKDIISSHFFDKKKGKDISYQELESLKKYFYVPGTCNFYLKKAMIGIGLENVLIHIGCDEEYGDITINFEEGQFGNHKNQDIADRLQKLLLLLQKIYKSGRVEEIILGFEPVDDADMKILIIGQNQMKIFNENIFKSPFANAIYIAAKNIQV